MTVHEGWGERERGTDWISEGKSTTFKDCHYAKGCARKVIDPGEYRPIDCCVQGLKEAEARGLEWEVVGGKIGQG